MCSSDLHSKAANAPVALPPVDCVNEGLAPVVEAIMALYAANRFDYFLGTYPNNRNAADRFRRSGVC